MQKINVLYVIPSLNIGGSEKKVMTMITHLRRDLFAPHLMLISEQGKLYDEALTLGIDIICMNKKSKYDLRIIKRMANYMKTKHIDIVHVFTSTGKLWGRLAACSAKVPVIISTEESLFRNTKLDRFLERVLAKKTDAIITNSQQSMISAQTATKLSPSLYHVIHNGIDLSPFGNNQITHSSSDKTNILCVARLDERKGLFYLIDAIHMLIQQHKNVHLSIAGDGKLYQSLADKVEENQLGKHVSLLGFVDNVPSLMATHDLFILPSLEEGFGNVILEAMASNLYVIATRVGGIPEIISSDDLGTLIEPKSADAIKEGILFAINNQNIIDQRRMNAYTHAFKHFSYTHMMKSHEKLYLDLYEKKVTP
ncbi:MAG: glycosyltransferase family 4 protein [Acholeplasmataceae bacterium]|jgi:glycosyltransferase involved in cell wall biosynthesis|nr:glycosyltransferase family 4 protein [Acholeplasmataceae bacterium]